MSFSLAKKNIKHKRKTMKRKQKGGLKIGIGRMSFAVPYTSNTSKKKTEFDNIKNMGEGTTEAPPPITEIRPINNKSENSPPSEGVARDTAIASARASTDQTTASSGTALVATLAAATHQKGATGEVRALLSPTP